MDILWFGLCFGGSVYVVGNSINKLGYRVVNYCPLSEGRDIGILPKPS